MLANRDIWNYTIDFIISDKNSFFSLALTSRYFLELCINAFAKLPTIYGICRSEYTFDLQKENMAVYDQIIFWLYREKSDATAALGSSMINHKIKSCGGGLVVKERIHSNPILFEAKSCISAIQAKGNSLFFQSAFFKIKKETLNFTDNALLRTDCNEHTIKINNIISCSS